MNTMAYLFEKSLPGISWEGEPAPDLFEPAILDSGGSPGDNPNGDLTLLADAESMGDVLAVGDVDRPGPLLVAGGYPMVRCSTDREDDIINYLAEAVIQDAVCERFPAQAVCAQVSQLPGPRRGSIM
jgi:hypothetical protein